MFQGQYLLYSLPKPDKPSKKEEKKTFAFLS